MKSIIQSEKACYFSGSTINLEKHHIFFGNADRKLSEKYGLWVWLRYDFHRTGSQSAHLNRDTDLQLKKIGQRAFEEKYSHDKFMEIFGRNYL